MPLIQRAMTSYMNDPQKLALLQTLLLKRISSLLVIQIIETGFFVNHVSWCIFCLTPPLPVVFFVWGPLSFWQVSSICGFCDWVLTLNVTGSQFVFATVERLDHQFKLYKRDWVCNVGNLEPVQWTLYFFRSIKFFLGTSNS